MALPLLTHPALQTRHGFFTREGGVSTGLLASLNCGERQDDPANVNENLRRVAEGMRVTPERLVSCAQIHSPTVITVTQPWNREAKPEADAMVTKEKDLALGIKTADCGPILFHDARAQVIGAAHAGWKGAVTGVLENTIGAMIRLGALADNITAVIGPCIQQPSYEVGPDFPAPFLKQDRTNEAFFKTAAREGHFMFDLPGYILYRLKQAGLKDVHSMYVDTCADEKRFFSYRRKTLRGESQHGTLISVITL